MLVSLVFVTPLFFVLVVNAFLSLLLFYLNCCRGPVALCVCSFVVVRLASKVGFCVSCYFTVGYPSCPVVGGWGQWWGWGQW